MTTTYDVVAAVAQALSLRIGEARFTLWFAGKTKLVHHDDHFAVGVPNLFLQEWLQNTFDDDVKSSVAEVLGASMPIRFVIDPELFQAARAREKPAAGSQQQAANSQQQAASSGQRPNRTRGAGARSRTLSSDLAIASPMLRRSAWSRRRTSVRFRSFFTARVGTGKTHLLEGVCAG